MLPYASRMAPQQFAISTALRVHQLRRSLVKAVVPMPTGVTGVGTGLQFGYELVIGTPATAGTNIVYRGEAHGPAIGFVNSGTAFATPTGQPLPNAGPISCFAFLVRRDTSTSIQTLMGNSRGTGTGGWSFQLNYGAGQIGLTRWGAADNPSTTLGAVPNTSGAASPNPMSVSAPTTVTGAVQRAPSGSSAMRGNLSLPSTPV
jgi:hypothetical protein